MTERHVRSGGDVDEPPLNRYEIGGSVRDTNTLNHQRPGLEFELNFEDSIGKRKYSVFLRY